jgi:hypothetical protein
MSKGVEQPRVRGNDGIEKTQEAILPFCRQKNENDISLKTKSSVLELSNNDLL